MPEISSPSEQVIYIADMLTVPFVFPAEIKRRGFRAAIDKYRIFYDYARNVLGFKDQYQVEVIPY